MPDATRPKAIGPTLLACLAVLGACRGDAVRGEGAGWRAERDTVGDTIVVRTIAGSVWGDSVRLVEELRIGELEGAEETTFGSIGGIAVDDAGRILVLDAQAMRVREFDAGGTYERSFASRGEGPGELSQPNGIAFHPDGRILVRDFGNARINVYSAAGEPLDTWRLPGGFFHNDPLHVDTAGHVLTMIIVERLEPSGWRTGLLRFDAAGQLLDTLRVPEWEYEPPTLTAVRIVDGRERGTSSAHVPFSPVPQWAYSPFGYFIGGDGTRYSFDLFRTGEPVLRIERVAEPVPVHPEERDDQVRVVSTSMRRTQPGWDWDGPQPPTAKPAFRNLRVDRDGRIWVRRYEPGRLRDDAAEIPDVDERGFARYRWTEPQAYDLFDADGRYLARLEMPERFRPEFMRGDHIWGVIRDEYDVQYVVRFRITR